MKNTTTEYEEEQRRNIQEYIFKLEDAQEKAEELAVTHEQLKRSQDLLLTVLRCTIHGICLVRDDAFVWHNHALTDILGWEGQELIGKPLESICPDAEAYARFREELYGSVRTGGLALAEHEFTRKDGLRVPCLVTGCPMDPEDLSKGRVFSITDITERKRSRMALENACRELARRASEIAGANEQLNAEIAERKAAEEQLNGYRNHLEDLVKERTAQLTVLNAKLLLEIEERKRTEQELKKANDYLEYILRNSPDAITIVDRRGEFIKWSQMAAELYGVSFEGLKGKKVFDLFTHPSERDELYDQLRRDGSVNKREIDLKRIDGSSFPVEMSVNLLKDDENKTIGSVAISRDLSGVRQMLAELRKTNERLSAEMETRRKAEDALRESENQYRTIFETTGTATVILDKDGTVLLSNAESESLTGFPSEEIQGKKKWMEFISEEDLPDIEDHFYLPPIGRDRPRRCEFRMMDRHGQVKDVLATISMIPGTWRSVASLLDITEQKRLEGEILKAQKLESIGILAGGIAHDFNNILTAILGNVSLAKMFAGQRDKVVERLDAMANAALRAKDLTQQLLTFSRGGMPVKKTVSISELIEDSARFALRGSNVKVEYSAPEDLWLVEIDEGQINQVINNLIINADQAMPDGGTITVEAGNVILDATVAAPLEPGPYVRISIRDEGVGIPPQHLDRIFDPYFTTKQKGSGLGLTTAHSIMGKHGGGIRVDSRLGDGSTFELYLPASEKEAMEERGSEPEAERGKGKILVMDDEEIVREVTGEMLEHLGYAVAFACDGGEAIALYEEAMRSDDPFDALIMDLTIPGGMGGKEAVQRLLRMDPYVKAIVSSGYSQDVVMANYHAHGFSGVVSKPFRMEELEEALGSVVRTGSRSRGR